MKDFLELVKIVVICITVIVVVFLILFTLPKSPLRSGIIKMFSIVSYGISVLSLAYIVNPVDLLPDIIPVVGQIDDLGALVTGLLGLLSGWTTMKKSKDSYPISKNIRKSEEIIEMSKGKITNLW